MENFYTGQVVCWTTFSETTRDITRCEGRVIAHTTGSPEVCVLDGNSIRFMFACDVYSDYDLATFAARQKYAPETVSIYRQDEIESLTYRLRRKRIRPV